MRSQGIWLECLALFACLSVARAQAPPDPYASLPPHEVPGCHPAPHKLKDGRSAAVCGCLGMVENVRRAYSSRCWGDAPGGADNETLRLGMILGLDLPPAIRECLANTPDHCQIVGAPRWRIDVGIPYDVEKRCWTACNPDRCHCADNPCRAHGVGL